MGSFGALNSEKIYFRLIDCLAHEKLEDGTINWKYENKIDCEGSSTHSVCEWHDYDFPQSILFFNSNDIKVNDGPICLPIDY